jgi:biopolymer transport protein ExbD
MAGGDVAAPRESKKGKKRKKGRRLGIRIDMTPLVDVAFLLLTFFMFDEHVSSANDGDQPPSRQNVKVEIAESNLLTFG